LGPKYAVIIKPRCAGRCSAGLVLQSTSHSTKNVEPSSAWLHFIPVQNNSEDSHCVLTLRFQTAGSKTEASGGTSPSFWEHFTKLLGALFTKLLGALHQASAGTSPSFWGHFTKLLGALYQASGGTSPSMLDSIRDRNADIKTVFWEVMWRRMANTCCRRLLASRHGKSWSIQAEAEVDKVAMGLVFLSEHFGFSLSMSFH
jgi:hypothetical protein